MAEAREGSPSTREELMTMHRNRRLIYAFLSRMYEKEVTVDLLKELTDGKNPILQVGFSRDFGDEKFRRGFELLGGYLRNASGRGLNQVKLELAVEYASLFLGVKRKPAHPSESVYTGNEQTMYAESRDRVLSAYWSAGVDKLKEYTEPEDHIAIELQFMEYLCRKEVEALEKGDNDEAIRFLKIQKDFIANHLAKWVPRLAKDILESAEVDFYKGVADITEAFVVMDGKAVASALDEMSPAHST